MSPRKRAAEAEISSPPPADSDLACLFCGNPVPQGSVGEIHDHILECRQRAIRKGTLAGWLPVSYSSLSDFEDCPAKHRFKTEHDRLGGAPADMGNVVHGYSELGVIDAGNDLALSLNDDFWKLIDAFDAYASRSYENGGLPANAEYEKEYLVEFELWPGMMAQLRAFLDIKAVEDGWVMIDDLKTGRVMEYEHWKVQRMIYALAAVRNDKRIWRGAKVRTVPLRFPGKVIQEGTWQISLVEIERFALVLKAKVKAMAEAYRDQRFPAKPGLSKCRMCDFAHKCDAAGRLLAPYELNIEKAGRSVKIPAELTPENREDWALASFHLEKLLTDVKKVLKEADRKWGPIRVEGGMYTHWQAESTRVSDVPAFITLCQEKGIPLHEVLNINAQTSKKYLDQDPDLAALGESVPARYPKFEWRKAQ